MAIQIQLRSGTTTEHNTFTGAVGEVTVDTTKDTLVVHDGVTAGGFPVAARANADGTISLIKKDGTSAGSVNATGLFNNTLTSTATDQALTAAQGKVLKDLADTKLNSASVVATGGAPYYVCRAWVNFNGTTGAIRASGNVSSVTSEGDGTYLITFTQGMSDANYVVNSVGSARGDATALAPVDGSFTTSSFRVSANYGGDNTAGAYAPSICCVTVFR